MGRFAGGPGLWRCACVTRSGIGPKFPELPPPGRFVLICVRTGSPRAEARRQVRAVLRQILAAWSQLSPEQLPLKETPRGPVWQRRLQGDLERHQAFAALRSLSPEPSPQGRGSSFSSGRACSPGGQAFSSAVHDPPSPRGRGPGRGETGRASDYRADWISACPTRKAKPG